MSYRVLIVDDSAAMRSVIARILRASNFDCSQVFEASDGENALEILGREWVDVIVTDINMPRMGGDEFMQRLALQDALRTIPVLVVSTDGSEKRMHQMLGLGAKGYLRKPFAPEQLREQLEGVLRLPHA